MNKSRRRLLQAGLALAASLAFGFSATAFAADQAASNIKLVEPGTLTVCSHLPYKPFEFVDKKGEVAGFDVDLARLLANELGVNMKVISIGWNQIISGAVFAAGKCDIAMGGATITAKRKKAVLFTEPYFKATQALLVKKDSGIKSLADLKGKRFGVQTATTGEIYAKKHKDANGYKIVVFDDIALETTAVSAGSVAAAINDNTPLAAYAKAHPDTAVTAYFDTGERYGFMVKKDDANAKAIADLFNKALNKAKKDGTYKKLYETWFGKLPDSAKL